MLENSFNIIKNGSLLNYLTNNETVKLISQEASYRTKTLTSLPAFENEAINSYNSTMVTKLNNEDVFSYVPTDGYYIATLVETLRKLEIKSLLDLGSGPGILLKVIYEVIDYNYYNSKLYLYNNSELKLGGIEYNQKYINIAKTIINTKILQKSGFKNVLVKKGDITKIRRQTIKDFECMYAYEPLLSKTLAEKFAKNLYNIMGENQLFILRPAAYMTDYLEEVFGKPSYINGLMFFWKK